MVEALSILKDTPIPTLLILGGIALLVLSVATNIANKVQVAKERQKWSGIFGLILIVLGAFLYLLPTTSPVVVNPTPVVASPEPPQATAAPTIISCGSQPANFADLWSGRAALLGCPLAGNTLKMTQQTFEHGWMISRQDTGAIYVLFSTHNYQAFNETWAKSEPVYSCPELAKSTTPPTPRNAFGKVWCSQQTVRDGLGLATEAEVTANAALQAFEHGLIFEIRRQVFMLVESSSSWEQLK